MSRLLSLGDSGGHGGVEEAKMGSEPKLEDVMRGVEEFGVSFPLADVCEIRAESRLSRELLWLLRQLRAFYTLDGRCAYWHRCCQAPETSTV